MSGISNQKKALQDWDNYRLSLRKGTPVNLTETIGEKNKRIAKLEENPEEWKRYYFAKFMEFESPDFHKQATKRLIKNFLSKRHWYEVRHWVRGLSKTTTTMMDVLYLVLTGKLKNIIYVSSTYDAAEAFLTKYQCQLDSNQRLINDYGKQELVGSWTMGSFTTRNGVKFLALGAGQSPRGNGNEEIRPDCIIMDDFDTDEECLNSDIINKKWRWFENALFFTVDTAKPYLILWLGNIISEDCCVVRAGKIADYCEIINIRDENGKSVWPQKNSEADIDYQLSKVSYEAGQQEMFNNPIRQGQAFKEMTFGKCPPLKALDCVITYADPSPSNKDKPSLKSKVQQSCKAVVVIGFYNMKFYVYKVWVDTVSNSTFLDWLYAAKDYVNNATQLYTFIENNSLQDPFYQQVLLPMIAAKDKELNTHLNVIPDDRDKPQKWFRIEGTLEPLNRSGNLILNIAEQDNPHMKRLVSQFLGAGANSKVLDGPDAVEGGVYKAKEKCRAIVNRMKLGARKTNTKRI